MKTFLIFVLVQLSAFAGNTFELDFEDQGYVFVEETPQKEKMKIKELLLDSGVKEIEKIDTKKMENDLLEQLQRRGGDDVGNGGDQLRQKLFLEMKELAQSQHWDYPDISSLIVVEGLKRPFLSTEYKGEFIVLLDRDIIQTSQRKGRDLRPMYLQILFPGHKNAMGIYQNLKPTSGRPFCYFDFSDEFVVKSPKDFFGESKVSATEARNIALRKCSEENLSGCFISSQEESGLFGKLTHKVVARGYNIQKKNLSLQEKKELACKATLACEELTFAAPFGQVSPQDFEEIGQLIKKNCP